MTLSGPQRLTFEEEGLDFKKDKWYDVQVTIKFDVVSVTVKSENESEKKLIDNFKIAGFSLVRGGIAIGSNFTKISFTRIKLLKF